MGIKLIGLDVLAINLGSKPILAVYTNGLKIWPTIIQSCFSNGCWIDGYPWLDDMFWVD